MSHVEETSDNEQFGTVYSNNKITKVTETNNRPEPEKGDRTTLVPVQFSTSEGLFNFERHGQNEVGNIAILVLLRDHEKLYFGVSPIFHISR